MMGQIFKGIRLIREAAVLGLVLILVANRSESSEGREGLTKVGHWFENVHLLFASFGYILFVVVLLWSILKRRTELKEWWLGVLEELKKIGAI